MIVLFRPAHMKSSFKWLLKDQSKVYTFILIDDEGRLDLVKSQSHKVFRLSVNIEQIVNPYRQNIEGHPILRSTRATHFNCYRLSEVIKTFKTWANLSREMTYG